MWDLMSIKCKHAAYLNIWSDILICRILRSYMANQQAQNKVNR